MDEAEVVSVVPRAVWRSVLASDPDAMPSQTPEWVDATCAGSMWQDASRLYLTSDGRRIIFPLTRIGIGSASTVMSPRRGWGYGGIIADGGVTPDDIKIVSDDLKSLDALRFWLRPNPLHAHLWDKFVPEMRRSARAAYVVDLEGGAEAVRSRFRRSANKGIKAAEKNGVRVETATHGRLLPEFFELAVRARAFWAQRQHEPVWLAQMRGRLRDSEAKWSAIGKHLGPDLQVSIAWYRDRPAAAGIVVRGPNAHGTRAAMDPELRDLGASHLLNWVTLQNACDDGLQWFHMGESATPGADEFKEFLGARRYEFDEIDFERIPLSVVKGAVRYSVKRAIGFREEPSWPSTSAETRRRPQEQIPPEPIEP